MQVALQRAQLASESGAVVVHNGQIVAVCHSEQTATGNPTAHAKILSLREAAASLCHWRLYECTLVVTLEPRVICKGALTSAGARTTIFSLDFDDS